LRIIGITNAYTQKNTAFKAKSEDIYDRAKRLELIQEYFEENHNYAYNTEYEPTEYTKVFSGYVRPMTLPSQRFSHHDGAFRDEELFYDDYDIRYYLPSKYDADDVPLDESLWQKFIKDNNANNYHYGIDTSLSPSEINSYEAVKKPWTSKTQKINKELDEMFKDKALRAIFSVKGANYKTANDILKSSCLLKNGEFRINRNLCKLAIELYKNSKQWTDTEKEIMKEIKVPMLKNQYIDYSEKKYKVVADCLILDYTNEEILNYLNERCNGTSIRLESVFSEDELKQLADSLQ